MMQDVEEQEFFGISIMSFCVYSLRNLGSSWKGLSTDLAAC